MGHERRSSSVRLECWVSEHLLPELLPFNGTLEGEDIKELVVLSPDVGAPSPDQLAPSALVYWHRLLVKLLRPLRKFPRENVVGAMFVQH